MYHNNITNLIHFHFTITNTLCRNPLHVSGVKRPSSGGTTLAVFGVSCFKHRSVQIKGNFTKLTLHLCFKCIMYYAGLLFCSVYYQ
jgi:hypothetical protein